jgi:very-short-patch-repair endonuclease
VNDARYGKIVSPGAAREKLEQARRMRRAATPAEATLWQALRGNRLCGLHFRRQQLIAGFIVDFYCHAVTLAIEVDGPIHGGSADYDAERDMILAAHGVRVLRVSNDDVLQRLSETLKRIAETCGVAGHLTPVSQAKPVPSRRGKGLFKRSDRLH